MKLNIPKPKVLLLNIDLLASSASKHFEYKSMMQDGESATVLQKYVVGSDR